jgi:hypothetical protein
MPFLRPGTATQEPAAMELPRKVAVAVVASVAAAVAAAVVVGSRALFVVDDAMLRAVDALKTYTCARAQSTQSEDHCKRSESMFVCCGKLR